MTQGKLKIAGFFRMGNVTTSKKREEFYDQMSYLEFLPQCLLRYLLEYSVRNCGESLRITVSLLACME